MTDLRVRIATPADVETWRALRLDGIVQHPEAFILSEPEARDVPVARDAARLSQGGQCLAFVDDRAVGLAGLRRNGVPRARHRGEIGPFYVVSDARGQGVADALMQTLFEIAQDWGIWQLELYVNAQSVRAMSFYRRHGFGEAGRVPNAILGAGGPETDVIMIRTAAPVR